MTAGREPHLHPSAAACRRYLRLGHRRTYQYKEAQWENAKSIADRAAWIKWIEALALGDVEKGLLKEQLELLGEC